MIRKPARNRFPVALTAALAISFTSVAAISTPTPARADWVRGSLIGGTAGAVIGGIIGGRGGVAAGAIIGGTVGAIEGDRRARAKYRYKRYKKYRRYRNRYRRRYPH